MVSKNKRVKTAVSNVDTVVFGDGSVQTSASGTSIASIIPTSSKVLTNSDFTDINEMSFVPGVPGIFDNYASVTKIGALRLLSVNATVANTSGSQGSFGFQIALPALASGTVTRTNGTISFISEDPLPYKCECTITETVLQVGLAFPTNPVNDTIMSFSLTVIY